MLFLNCKRVGMVTLLAGLLTAGLAACQSELPPMPGGRRATRAPAIPDISSNPESEVFTGGQAVPLIVTDLPNTKDESFRVRTILDQDPISRPTVTTTTLPATRPGVIDMTPSGTQPSTR